MMNRKLFLILFLNIVISFGLSSAAAAQQVPVGFAAGSANRGESQRA